MTKTQRISIKPALDRLTWSLGRAVCFIAWVIAFSMAALASRGADSVEPSSGLKRESLRIGFTMNAFRGANRNDVEASFKAFVETLGRRRGYLITSEVEIFEELNAFAARIRSGAINLAIVDTWNYQVMNVYDQLTPFYVSMGKSGVGRRYLLLSRRGSGFDQLSNLRGKRIMHYSAANANLGGYWLETLLLDQHLGTPADFFEEVQTVAKPSLAVLPVYFGKCSACLVDEPGFEVMQELNPQVGKQLQVITRSEPLVNSVICLSKTGWNSPAYQQDIVRALGELHLEPAGQQILTLFKSTQLAPFDEKYLSTIKALKATYNRHQTADKP